MLTILYKASKYLGIALGIAFPQFTCNHKAVTGKQAAPVAIVLPLPAPGDTARFVSLEMDIKQAKKPSFLFTDLPYDKSKGFLLMKDDGLATDYTVVYKILNGGTVYGKQYPGFTYTDGAGKKINYKYSFAINANDEHGTSPNATTWAQIAEMVSKGHSIMNHSMFHGGTDKLKAIKDAEKNLWLHTHYRMTELVPPGNDEGFTATGLQLGYTLISSEFGEPVPDGNNDPGNMNMSWGSYIPMKTQNFNKVLVSRTNLGDQWNSSELKNAKIFVDFIFNRPDKEKKLVGTAFSHGPFGDKKESADIFFQFLKYIQDHPANRDSVWITSSRELVDYEKTKKKVVINSEKYDQKSGKYKIVFDMNKIDPNVMYRNLSLKVKGGVISNVKAIGANEVTFNPATGLINIYKTDRSKVLDPFKDRLPPQILKVTAKNNTINIIYDKPVHQTKKEGYEVTGNKVTRLTGNGKVWQLELQNEVTSTQTFYYRMQRGDASQADDSSFKVCTYAGTKLNL